MSENERVLLEKARNGDVEAFERLIEGYQKRVYNIALRMIGNPEDANDLAQEVFIRIFKSIGSFKEQSAFSTWIYRITTNVCLDELRRRKNRNVISLDEEVQVDDGGMQRQIASDKPQPDQLLEQAEMKRMVLAAINTLKDEHKTAIILRDIQGFSYEEIANIVKCPEGTVKSRINRARQALKEILEKKAELFIEGYVKIDRKGGWR